MLDVRVIGIVRISWAALLRRITVVSVGYHIRAPKPYAGSDWTGELAALAADDPAALSARLEDYESHVVDLEWGVPTERAGGFGHLTALAGAPPVAVGASTDAALRAALWGVFSDATFFVQHGRRGRTALGDQVDGHWLRPEDVDLNLIEIFEPAHARGGCDQSWSEASPEVVLDTALADGCGAVVGAPPCVVAVKIHDNDLFACDSAWTTVYGSGALAAGPPFPVDRMSPLLSPERRARRFDFYAGVVRRAASLRDTTPPVSVSDMARALPDEP